MGGGGGGEGGGFLLFRTHSPTVRFGASAVCRLAPCVLPANPPSVESRDTGTTKTK